MKNATHLLFLGLSLALAASTANASFYGPILTKVTTPGLTPPQYSYSSQCEIYPDKVVLTLGVDGLTSKEEHKTQLAGELFKTIENASKGQISKTEGPTDSPGFSYSATKILPNDATQKVELGSRLGTTITSNDAQAAELLRNFIDRVCGDANR